MVWSLHLPANQVFSGTVHSYVKREQCPIESKWHGLVWLASMAWYGKVVWLASMAWSSAQTVIIFQPRCFLSFWSDLTKSWWWSWWSFDKYINRICTFFFKSNIGNLLPACVPSGWSNSKWHTAPSTRLLGRHTSWIGIASVLDISARRFWIKIFAKVRNDGVCRIHLESSLFTALIAGCWGYQVLWLIYCLGLVLVQLWYFPTVISHMFKSHSIPWNQSFRGCKNYSTLPIPLSSFSAPEFKFRWLSPWSLLWHRSMTIIIIIIIIMDIHLKGPLQDLFAPRPVSLVWGGIFSTLMRQCWHLIWCWCCWYWWRCFAIMTLL